MPRRALHADFSNPAQCHLHHMKRQNCLPTAYSAEPPAKRPATVTAKTAFAMSNAAMERHIQGSETGFSDFSRFQGMQALLGPVRRIPDRRRRRPKKRSKGEGRGMWRRNRSIARAKTPNMMCAKTFAWPRTRTWRPPNPSFSRALTRSTVDRLLYRVAFGSISLISLAPCRVAD